MQTSSAEVSSCEEGSGNTVESVCRLDAPNPLQRYVMSLSSGNFMLEKRKTQAISEPLDTGSMLTLVPGTQCAVMASPLDWEYREGRR